MDQLYRYSEAGNDFFLGERGSSPAHRSLSSTFKEKHEATIMLK